MVAIQGTHHYPSGQLVEEPSGIMIVEDGLTITSSRIVSQYNVKCSTL